MRHLVRSRPPFSNLFGHPHRRLKKPQNPSSSPGSRRGQEPADDTPSEGTEPQEAQDQDLGQEPQELENLDAKDIEETELDEPNEDQTPDFAELDDASIGPKTLPGLVLSNPELIIREFDSFYDFVTCASDKTLNNWHRASGLMGEMLNRPDWYGTKSFEQAVEMALHHGWPEGRRLLNDALAAIAPHPEPFRSQLYDVGGVFPVLPLYIAGDPACMVEFQNDHIASRPIVRIDYDAYTWDEIDALSIMLYGASVLSLAVNLEAQGYSVELRMFIEKSHYRSPSHRTSFIYKRAGENLDLDRAAFAIANPTVHRRFEFALLEQSPECQGYRNGYGYHPDKPLIERDEMTIYIPFLEKKKISAEEAKALVQNAADSFLKDKDIAA